MSTRVLSVLKISLLLAPLALLPIVSCQHGGGGGGGGNNPVANALLACGLLTPGKQGTVGTLDAFDTCMAQCIASGTCTDLEAYVCEGDFSLVDGCLEQCTASNGFDCGDGQKVLPLWKCDGSADCMNGADEVGCEPNFMCGDGTEVPPTYKCDGEPDCQDSSDEAGCPALPMFTCTNGTSIPATWQCDYEEDCPDGSDETGCAQLVCPNADTGETLDPSDTGPLETGTGL